jgi:hypothetical protein
MIFNNMLPIISENFIPNLTTPYIIPYNQNNYIKLKAENETSILQAKLREPRKV